MQHQPMILAIETTGPLASVALSGVPDFSQEDLLRREEGVLTLVNRTNYSHLEEIAPMVKAILREGCCEPEDIDAIAVSRGPGSFTGIRIGMATAKGLAQIWEKPIVCVPTLASFAYGKYDFASWEGLSGEPLICPLFDARRSQVYAGVYQRGSREALLKDGAYDVPDYLEKLGALLCGGRTAVFFGDGCDAYREVLRASGFAHCFAPEQCRYQLAPSVLNLALALYEQGALTDAFGAEPEYLRQAEAERKLQAGELGKKKVRP